jgi:hypothetical protein
MKRGPQRRPPVWKIARGARGPGEWADRVVRFLAIVVVVAIVGYIAWVLIRHFSRQFAIIKKPYKSALEMRIAPEPWRRGM